MTIAKDFASKLAVAFVAVAMVFSAFASTASAQTTEELQQMINDLLAQVAQLQGELGQGGDSMSSDVCPYTWTRDLSSGSTGADVMKLQQFLNSDADTRVSVEGAGSAGMETEYYGPATAAAVSKFQVKYRSEILSPANLVNPTGYFGPSSRAKANGLCVSSPAMDDEDMMDDEDDSDDDSSFELSGEASLDTFEVDDADDTDVEEGDEDVEIAVITVEFSDGDAEISRLDLAFTDSEGADSDAWDVFESFSLWVDGDKVAEEAADDDSDYLGDEDNGIIRFSGLDIIGMEDEDFDIVVAATINNNLDAAELGEWDVDGVSIRFFDADGVATTEDGAPVTDDTATFNIEEIGTGDELVMESSDSNPDARTIALDEDNNTEEIIFAFDLSAEDSDGDVVLDNLISIDVVVATTAASVGDDMDNLVKDFRIEIDGESFDAESYDGTGLTATIDFDIDGDFVIGEGETVTVVLYADFEDMDAVDEGSTIIASIDTDQVDAEGDNSGETITVGGSDRNGKLQTLRTTGLELGSEPTDGTDSTDSTQVVGETTDDNYGTMFLEFEITAFGDDLWVPIEAATEGAADTSSGLTYQILKNGVATTTNFVAVLDWDIEGADEDNGYYELEADETYTVTVSVESLNPEVTGLYSFRVNSIGFNDAEDTAPDSGATPDDAAEYESDAVSIQS
ncbi:hypothetical protein KC851_00535 [Candidatus Kaiserbacteria bacterium]|nr:hypothetical protein [Candidatus Kaiserbacteria bacterium]